MILAWIVWLLLMLMFGVSAVVFESGFAFALSVVTLVLPLAAIIANRFSRGIEFETDIPEKCEKGETVKGNMIFDNRSILAHRLIKLTLRFENRLTGEVSLMSTKLGLYSKNNASAELKFKSELCGCVDISCEKVRVYDFLGLTYKTVDITQRSAIAILPEIFPMNVRFGSSIGADDVHEYADMAGTDLSEVYDLREYDFGDSPRQIQWKLSEKHDSLIVKRGSVPQERSALLILANVDKSSAQQRSAAAEAFISLSYELCQNGVAHRLMLQGDENGLQTYDIECEDDLFALLTNILRSGVADNAYAEIFESDIFAQSQYTIMVTSGAEIADEAAKHCSRVLLLGESDNEDVIAFSPTLMREQLAQTEI